MAEEMMGQVWEQGSLVLLDRLSSYLRRHRTGPKQEALESLRDYVGQRVAMTDYRRSAGWAMTAVPVPPNRCVAG